MIGQQTIAMTLDTMTHADNILFEAIPKQDRIISLAQSTIENNIIMLGFD
jgi:chromosome condensin MukBEF complex kleisin-like MukF subunit